MILHAPDALAAPDAGLATPPAAFGPIVLSRGVGSGPTSLAAFDDALGDAGVANYNLVTLSSVIPPGSRIERRRWLTPESHWGRRLYCVLSQARATRPGQVVHAGIGWVQGQAAGQGLFVELHDDDRDRLQRDLEATLGSMQRRRGITLGPVHTEIASARCDTQPACALVIAVYASAPW